MKIANKSGWMENNPNKIMIQDSESNERNLISEYGRLVVYKTTAQTQAFIGNNSR